VKLAGKVALITGASQGIGHAIAQGLAGEGARIVVADLQRADEAAADFPDGVGLTVDVASEEDVARMADEAVERCGRIDILVNNAGIAERDNSTWDMPVEDWGRTIAVDLTGVFLACRAALPGMIERGWGRIVNVSSESAIGPGTAPYPGTPIIGDTAYGAQKAAIERFTQGLAEEVYPAGVGVASIAPSLIVPTPGALANAQITGPEDPRAEDPAYMPEAIRVLVTDELDRVAGRVLYSQQLLLEKGLIESGGGLGVDPARRVTGYVTASTLRA
jgi:NAD(P)-dependent dehydrogenase (short-subunit alcohol dehydrogenase family)